MKVCVVDLNGPFGPLNSFSELLEPLEARGISFSFVVPESVHAEVAEKLAGRAIEAVPARRAIGRDAQIVRIVRRQAKQGLDIIHANSTSAARSAVIAGATARVPVVVHLRNSLLSPGERRFLRVAAALPMTLAMVAVSSAAAATTGSRANRCTVLPDAVSPGPRRPCRAASVPARVGVVVNQQPTKGLDIFVDVFERLAEQPIAWEVFGSAGIEPVTSPYVAAQRRRLEEADPTGKVTFHGVVANLADRLPELDVMLLTSRRESFSRVAVESMLAGLPLVAPLIPGLAETLEGGRHGTVYSPEDPVDAALHVRSVLRSYDEALEAAELTRSWAAERFEPAAIAPRLATIYEGLRRESPSA